MGGHHLAMEQHLAKGDQEPLRPMNEHALGDAE